MDLVEISVYAEGYYSESEYNEVFYLPKDYYEENVKDKIPNKFCISELDGKFSETDADITISYIPSEKQSEYIFNLYTYACDMRDHIYYAFQKVEESEEFKEQMKLSKEYINSLDRLIDMKVRVRKSQVEKVNEFIKSLK